VNYDGYKNRIINGAMVISQRGTTFSGLTDGNNATYTVDRWAWQETGTSTGVQTVTQDTSSPTGYINSLKVLTTTIQAVGAGNSYGVYQWIEGLNTADLAWGTASAATVTLSFWVRSSLTGTFAGGLRNDGFDRTYIFNYTINVANTWEQKTVTITGSLTGTWLTTNGRGIGISFDLGTGSTYQTTANAWAAGNYFSTSGAQSVIGTLNATFYITGVQLEKGSTATSFDYRPYGTELALCKRYYNSIPQYWQGSSAGIGQGQGWTWTFPVTMRATPAITFTNQTSGSGAATTSSQGPDGCGMYSIGNVNGQVVVTVTASIEL
jgi:hypothetical protein